MGGRWWFTGSIAVATLLIVIHLLYPALQLGGPLWYILGIVAAILLISIYHHKEREIDLGAALNLGVAGLLYVTGLKVLVVSVVLLVRGASTEPFGYDDLGFIGLSGFIVMLVAYKAASETFGKKGDSSES